MVSCRVKNNRVEIRTLSSGRFQVSVNHSLVGVFGTPSLALFEAAEKLRQLTGWGDTPTLPKRFRESVQTLAVAL